MRGEPKWVRNKANIKSRMQQIVENAIDRNSDGDLYFRQVMKGFQERKIERCV